VPIVGKGVFEDGVIVGEGLFRDWFIVSVGKLKSIVG